MAHSEPSKQVSLATLGASKNVKFRMSRNSMKFDGVTRFRETIPMVMSISRVLQKPLSAPTIVTLGHDFIKP